MKFLKYLLCISLIVLITGCKDKIFSLEEKYYTEASLIEIDNQKLQQLINDKESFAVFVYQPLCENSTFFENIINDFISSHNMSFYKIAFSSIKDTSLGKTIKYYPSFIIYEDGEIIDYLEADNNEDTIRYKDKNEFKNWLSSYIKINDQIIESSENTETSKEEIEITVKLDNLTYDENKVNIYLFWGDGCPHCENAINFLNSIENEYGNYYKLNKFEVWHNMDNLDILQQFANKMGDEVSVIPYIIIGDKTFKGFNEGYKQQIIEAITSQYKDSYDVYFR